MLKHQLALSKLLCAKSRGCNLKEKKHGAADTDADTDADLHASKRLCPASVANA